MPVPASDAIASDIGHGALGVRYGLRPMRELLAETSGQRHVWAELRPKKVLSSVSWTDGGGGTYYYQAVGATFDGVMLRVVGVKTLTETLTQLEYGRALTVGTWEAAGDWVYVRLTGDADPAATTVIVELGIHVGSHGVVQPLFASERLVNGGLEAWTGSTPDGWTLGVDVSAGSITLDKTATDLLGGAYAARFTLSAATGYYHLYQGLATASVAVGGLYRISGAYRSTCAPGGVGFELWVTDGTAACVGSDGRTIVGGTIPILRDSAGAGVWQRFAFDFVMPSWANVYPIVRAQTLSGTQTGTVDIDDVKLQPIARYAFHEPLLTLEGLPSIDVARQDAFYGPVSVGLGNLVLANGHRRFDAAVASLDWTNMDVVIRVGGRFGNGGNEILFEDTGVALLALASDPIVTDTSLTLRLSDARSALTQNIPSRYYTPTEFPDLAEQDRGRTRPLVFGTVLNIPPARLSKQAAGGGLLGLGVYEVADVSEAPNGTKIMTSLASYIDEEAAAKQDTTRRKTQGNPSGYTVATGALEVDADYRIIEIVSGRNDYLDFTYNGTTYAAQMSPGLHWWAAGKLGDAIKLALNNAVPGSNPFLDPYYDLDTGGKVTISVGLNTWGVLTGTGANKHRSLWPDLGFTTGSDLVAAVDQTSDAEMFTDCDSRHIIRVTLGGFADDSSGTYTGSASATIEKAPDVALYLMNRHLKIPLASIDVASFVAARASHAEPLSVYLGAGGVAPQAMEILEIIEVGAGADICLEGSLWVWRTRDTSTPAGVVDLFDYDLLTWEAGYNAEDYYSVVQVAYKLDPDGMKESIVQQTTSAVALRFGRPQQRTFRTYLRDEADATTRLGEIATEASTKRRRFRFTAKGKLLLTPVGAKVRVNRTRGLGTSGILSQVLVRILSKADNLSTWTSFVEAVEVV